MTKQEHIDAIREALERISNMNTTDNALNPSILMSNKHFAIGQSKKALTNLTALEAIIKGE